jgi:class 3 adenylate cyclase
VVAVTVTANVLVTDLVGSTLVLSRQGELAADEVRRRHDALVTNVLEVFHGEVVKSTGDGTLALLPSADLLVRAAAAIAETARRNGMGLRVGLASGDVLRTDADCFGEAIVIATRLCDGAEAGQVLVAPSTVAMRGRRDEPLVRALPPRTLKGFDEPIDVHEVDATVAAPPRATAGAAADIVGRADVLAVITSSWDVTANRPVVLLGEPGIGKTCVAEAACSTIGGDPIWVSFEPTVSDGFLHLCAAIDAAARHHEIGPVSALGRDCAERAAAHLPSLIDRLPLTPVAPDDDDRTSFFDAVIAVAGTLGASPVLVLDDLQWAGGTTLAFLQRVGSSATAPRVLATCRRPLPAGMDAVDARVVDVSGLEVGDLETILRVQGFAGDVVDRAAREGAGNPLLAIAAAGAGTTGAGIDAIAARFRQLAASDVAVIGAAALIGRRVDLAALARCTGRGREQVAAALDAAVARSILRVDDQGGLVFVHDLVRETAIDTVPRHRRAALHAAIADILEDRGDLLGAVPHLLDGFAALEPRHVADKVLTACAILDGRGAHEDQLAIATRLLDELERDDRASLVDVARAHLAISTAHTAVGAVPAVKHHAGLAGAAALAAEDRETLIEAAIGRARYAVAGIVDRETLTLLEVALQHTGPDDTAARARLLAMRAQYLFHQEGDGARARASMAESLAAGRAARDPSVLADVVASAALLGMAHWDVVRQASVLEELDALGSEVRHRDAMQVWLVAARLRLVLALQHGDRGGFEEHRARSATLAEQAKASWLDRLGEVWAGLAWLLDGEPLRAEANARHALRVGEADHNLLASWFGQLHAARRWDGTLPRDAKAIERLAAQEGGMPLARSMGALSMAIAGAGDAAPRLLHPIVTAPMPLVDDSTLGAQCAALVESCTLAGLTVPAVVGEELGRFAGQLIVMSWGVDVVGAADRFLAVLAVGRGDRADARRCFDTAVELEQQLSMPLALRTQAWRHVMLGDIPEPNVPAALGGLHAEIAALRRRGG